MSLAMRRVLTALAVVVASVALVLLVEVERAAAKAVVRGDEVVLASKRHTTTGANSPVQLANHYAASSSSSSSHTMELPDLINATILQLQHGLKNGHFSSQDLILAYLKRIDEVNDELHAVIETSPSHKLLAEAKKLDEERKGGCRGHLHGIPMLVKDNIGTDVSLGMNTTAGSYSLLDSVPAMDAPLIAELRKKGAIIIGKANLSVWAQDRGNLTQGWSPRGGYTYSAYYPHGNACSSSSGSGVSASIGLAAATLGSETDGSIICPSSRNGIVGMKPTIGFASRFGVVPISSTQDSAGPIVRTVDDAAIVLTGMFTPASKYQAALDAKTAGQPPRVQDRIDYAQHLLDADLSSKKNPLAGVRLGITHGAFLNATEQGFDPEVVDIFHKAIKTLRQGGAEIVDVTFEGNNATWVQEAGDAEGIVFNAEQQEDLNTYLSYLKKIPSGSVNIGAVIQFAIENPSLELPAPETDQSNFITALKTPYYAPREPGSADALDGRRLNATYAAALATGVRVGKAIDRALEKYNIQALVAPSDSFLYSLAAKAGYPAITVPAGFLRNSSDVEPLVGTRPIWPFPGAPAGLNFVAGAWSEETLLYVARGFEVMQIRKGRGGYDGVVRTTAEGTPKTQLSDVLS